MCSNSQSTAAPTHLGKELDRYRILVRGELPSDLVEKVSMAHVRALDNLKETGSPQNETGCRAGLEYPDEPDENQVCS